MQLTAHGRSSRRGRDLQEPWSLLTGQDSGHPEAGLLAGGRLHPGRELQPGQRRLLPQRWAADQRPLDVLGRQQAINLRFDEIVIGLGGEIEGVGPNPGARPQLTPTYGKWRHGIAPKGP